MTASAQENGRLFFSSHIADYWFIFREIQADQSGQLWKVFFSTPKSRSTPQTAFIKELLSDMSSLGIDGFVLARGTTMT
jgi:hypothetical protein